MVAFGAFQHPPQLGGLDQVYGNVVAYVRSTGVQTGDPEEIAGPLYTSLNDALALCRSGFGDTVAVLPDHDEDITSADQMDNLVAGTRIIGIGHGTLKPKLTWTAAASTFLFDVANVRLENFQLQMAESTTGGVTVAAPITVSAAGCAITDCDIYFGEDANDNVTIGITTTTAADNFSFLRNRCYGKTAAECTTFMRLVGADYFRMEDCVVQGATSSTTVGVVQFLTTASTFISMKNCTFQNNKASSVHAVTGMAGLTGTVEDCNFGILDNATLAGFETEGSAQFFGCRTANLAGEESAVKTPTSV